MILTLYFLIFFDSFYIKTLLEISRNSTSESEHTNNVRVGEGLPSLQPPLHVQSLKHKFFYYPANLYFYYFDSDHKPPSHSDSQVI